MRRRSIAAAALAVALALGLAPGCGGPSKPPVASTAGEGSASSEPPASTETAAETAADPGAAGAATPGDPATGAATPGDPATPPPGDPGGAAPADAARSADASSGPAPGDCADATSKMQDELMPQWDTCWTKAPKKNRVPGKAVVEVRVDDSGKIADVAYQGSKAFGKRASRCMVAATKATTFSAPACAGRTLTIQKNYGPGAIR
jgi:hypothetical protein